MGSLSQYFQISGKLGHNKIIPILLLILLSSCYFPFNIPRRTFNNFHTEIICPGQKILIKNTYARETYESALLFYRVSTEQKTKPNYTVLKYLDGYMVQIRKMPPERLLQCHFRTIRMEEIGYWYDGMY